MNAVNLPPASVLRPELRARLERLEHLERRERQGRYARWHVPAPVEREPEGWLLTYLDLITLLLVMLVVMLAFSQPRMQNAQASAPAMASVAGAADEPVAAAAHTGAGSPQALPHAAADTAPMTSPPLASLADTDSPSASSSMPSAQPVDIGVLAASSAGAQDPQSGPQTAGGHDRPAPTDVALVGSVRSSQSLQAALPFSYSYDSGGLSSGAMPIPAGGIDADETEVIAPADATQDAVQPQPREHRVADDESATGSGAPGQVARPAPSLQDLGLDALGDNIDVIVNEESVSFRINNEILFTSGQADLMPSGLDVLTRLAGVLARNDYQIAVEGHTDPVPIQNERFPSNWELSTGRATSVLRHLQSQGIPASRLRATGYADTRPIAPNDSPAGRAFNRRVELIMEMPRAARNEPQSSSSTSAGGAISLPGSDFSGPIVRLR